MKSALVFLLIIGVAVLGVGFYTGELSIPIEVIPNDSEVNLERTLTEGDLQLINEIVDAKIIAFEQTTARHIYSQIYKHLDTCHNEFQTC